MVYVIWFLLLALWYLLSWLAPGAAKQVEGVLLGIGLVWIAEKLEYGWATRQARREVANG